MHKTWLGAVILVGLIFGAYHNSFEGPFIFDDLESIPQNPSIRSLRTSFSPPSSNGTTVSGRPVLNASFALNRAISGPEVAGFHVGNLVIHALAALVLLSVCRRTLASAAVPEKLRSQAAGLAWAASALWALHPLQTESVTYVVQRAESLVGLFYLLTLYGFSRYAASRSSAWLVFACATCLLGMGSKEVMATAPFVVFLYDRTFVSGTFREAWRRHGKLHVLLAGTLAWLAFLVISERGRGGSVGVSAALSWWNYLCTQAVAIVRYVRLTFWPSDLTLDYGVLIVRNFAIIALCGLPVLAALAATVWLIVHRPAAGFLGAWFFAILAPSSSVIPVLTQTVAEHRMYLPLASLVVGAVLLAGWHLRRGRRLLVCLLLLAAGATTMVRNRDYRDEVGIWEDVVRKQPDNWRAWTVLGTHRLHKEKNYEAARRDLEQALRYSPNYPEALNSLGQALIKLGRRDEGMALAERSMQLSVSRPVLHAGYGSALMDCGRFEEALPHLGKALAATPESAALHYNIATVLMKLGRLTEAESHFQAAFDPAARDADLLNNYGTLLRWMGRLGEAVAMFNRALEFDPASAKTHNNLGVALAAMQRPEESILHLREALRLDPGSLETRINLAGALAAAGRFQDAALETENALQARPDADLYNNLGALYGQLGQLDKAGTAFEQALRLNPGHPGARENLAKLRSYLREQGAR